MLSDKRELAGEATFMERFWCGVRDSADLPSPRPIHISINLGITMLDVDHPAPFTPADENATEAPSVRCFLLKKETQYRPLKPSDPGHLPPSIIGMSASDTYLIHLLFCVPNFQYDLIFRTKLQLTCN